MMNCKRNGGLITLVTVVGLTLMSPAQANSCKGLEEKPCGETEACSWVKSYTNSAGKTINGYCRSKPAKKDKSADAPSDAGKTSG